MFTTAMPKMVPWSNIFSHFTSSFGPMLGEDNFKWEYQCTISPTQYQVGDGHATIIIIVLYGTSLFAVAVQHSSNFGSRACKANINLWSSAPKAVITLSCVVQGNWMENHSLSYSYLTLSCHQPDITEIMEPGKIFTVDLWSQAA